MHSLPVQVRGQTGSAVVDEPLCVYVPGVVRRPHTPSSQVDAINLCNLRVWRVFCYGMCFCSIAGSRSAT